MITRRQAVLSVFSGALAQAQSPAVSSAKLRVIAIGAHPDDCDIKFGGTAAKFARDGHAVKFLSVTNGDAGHHEIGGARLAQRRFLETQESARRLGIQEYEVLDNHDGELTPTLEARRQIVRAIRKWKADLVFAPRPNDYHPDHRYTGVLVQDAAYMVVVPNVVGDTAPLDRNPVFLYYEDNFQKPAPFRADVIVPIDDVIEKKVDALDAHVSQFYEWLPWVDRRLHEVPKDPAARRKWLASSRRRRTRHPDAPAGVAEYEVFELCEYGRRPPLDELRKMFPLK
jgi:LmbE family N-acetylglucosaminyl deacetylase